MVVNQVFCLATDVRAHFEVGKEPRDPVCRCLWNLGQESRLALL